VVSRRLLEEAIDRRRRVVHGRRVDPQHAPIAVHLVSGSQLQPRDAVCVDVHEMQARHRDGERHVLVLASVAACKEQCLAPGLR
jgi:hypothetical protein